MDDVLALLDGIDTLMIAKGRKTVRVDLKTERPSDADLTEMLLGRSGNLRAPTIKRGRTMLVGFNAEMYGDALTT